MNPLIILGSAILGLGLIAHNKKENGKKLDADAKPVPESKTLETQTETQPETENVVNSESDLISGDKTSE